jgi:hypothetical protein
MIKAILAATAAVASASVTACTQQTLFSIGQLSLTPDPPIVGQNSTLSITYSNPGPVVSAGKTTYSINYNGLPYSSTEDLCTTQVVCPIEVGKHTVVTSALWDGSLSGKISTTIHWYNEVGTELLCIQTLIRT